MPPFLARPLEPADRSEALELVRRHGIHGIYVANALAGEGPEAQGGEAVVLRGRERLVGVLWFGQRGNLIAVHGAEVDPDAVAAAVDRSRWPWRIVLGTRELADALRARKLHRPLLERDQIYYGVGPGEVAAGWGRDDLRPAVPADMPALVDAALQLNRDDLHVPPARVDREWLDRTLRERIDEGTTWVIGPPGGPLAKLDLGSGGRAGWMLEGVFTFPGARRRGLATALVASTAERLLQDGPRVCLHVAFDNTAARRAYERAGMTEQGGCRLLLVG